MSSAGIPQEAKLPSSMREPSAAVLYVCAARSPSSPELAAERAEQEGHEYAQEHGLRVMEVVTDPYGEPDPSRRKGWQRVQAMAAAGSIAVVLVRWPVVIAPESRHEDRYREVARLRDLGVSVRYTWAPLAASNEETR